MYSLAYSLKSPMAAENLIVELTNILAIILDPCYAK
jgi:hypothetical protein